MKSRRKPGETPGVAVTRSNPSGTNTPNSKSSSATPTSSAQVGARGCRALSASAAAKWPAYISGACEAGPATRATGSAARRRRRRTARSRSSSWALSCPKSIHARSVQTRLLARLHPGGVAQQPSRQERPPENGRDCHHYGGRPACWTRRATGGRTRRARRRNDHEARLCRGRRGPWERRSLCPALRLGRLRGRAACAYPCDVTDAGSIARAFDATRRDLGDVEVLVYNASKSTAVASSMLPQTPEPRVMRRGAS